MTKPIVLLVDDESALRQAVTEILESMGVSVFSAVGATEALMLIGDLTPDLLLCDVMMPDFDGLSLIRQLRADTRWDDLPILVVSALATGRDQAAAQEAGADGFLAKPFTTEELREAVGRHLPLEPQNSR